MIASRRWIIVVGVMAVLVGAVTATVLNLNWLSGKSIPGLNQADRLILYSIDGTDGSASRYEAAVANGAEVFQRYVVLGELEIDNAKERARLITALQQAARWPDGPPNKCFWPRHAIVAIKGSKQQEIVICFQCRQYTLDGRTFPIIAQRPAKLLNEHLQRAGIPIAP